ncbi:type I-E CRISPR-associated protein Cse1/CasA [Actinoplanes sp. NPDC049668]|uniref:type I-E CRISPR-associated protein Cse1/CasA n=1 Tax=unclassified Actinoplanes TaxID=2626549 RepID=UPI0033A83675
MSTVTSAPAFDVALGPWIPVLVDGSRRLLSLRECLVESHRIDGLAVDTPLETVAVFRQVLLPAYLDAMFGGPQGLPPPADEDEWHLLWNKGRLDAARIGDYLERYADRFQLFGPRPFAQVAGLATAGGDTKPVSLLIAAAASGNNVPLFSARTEADPPSLTPAEALRALLATQCFDTAGIKSGAVGDPAVKAGKTTGNVTGPLGSLGVVVPWGQTLFETLMLHTPIQPQPFRATDRPQWRTSEHDSDDPAGPAWRSRPAQGLLDLLTWQARRIRLLPERDGDRVVIRRVVVAAGDRLSPFPQDVEPHTAWKPSTTSAGQVPVRHVAGRAAWRGLQALLAVGDDPGSSVTAARVLRQIADLRAERCLPADLPVQVMTVGVQYGTQSAVVEEVIVDHLPLPLAALDPHGPVAALLGQVVAHADDLRVAANRFGDELREAAGGDKLAWNQGQRIGDTLVHRFTPVVHRLLTGLQHQPQRAAEAEAAWRTTARRYALEVIDPAVSSAPPTAFLGRDANGHPRRTSTAEARYRSAINTIIGTVSSTPIPAGG